MCVVRTVDTGHAHMHILDIETRVIYHDRWESSSDRDFLCLTSFRVNFSVCACVNHAQKKIDTFGLLKLAQNLEPFEPNLIVKTRAPHAAGMPAPRQSARVPP